MAKAYLIGGAPRVGKTTLTLSFLKNKPILAASTDAIRYTLRRVIEKDKEPNLFNFGKFTSNDPDNIAYLKSHIQEIVDVQNKESVIVWKSVVNFIRSNLEDGFDVLIEGVAVLPELVKQLDFDYSAVFLGNQSHEHFETVLSSAINNQNDWLHNLKPETIEAFCIFGQSFSRYIQEEAEKNDLSYIEVNDKNFDGLIQTALEKLLKT